MFAGKAVILALLAIAPAAPGQDAWRFANPRPHGNNIIEFGLSAGRYWEVGDRGSVHTSTDLDTWLPHETGLRHSLRGIAFFNGGVFISGEAGLILTGPGPDALAAHFLGTADWLEAIAASPDALVAVGDNGAIYRSADGQAWSRKGSFSAWLRGVAFGAGQFVCVGEGGFIATSPDGQSWQRRNGPAGDLNRVAFIQDRFWVAGDAGTVLTNDSKMAFKTVTTGVTNNLVAVAGNATDIVLAGELAVLAGKASGGPWVNQVAIPSPGQPAPSWPYYSALWDGRLFLLGGRTGMAVEGFRTNAAAPLQWFSEPQPTRAWLWSVTRAPGHYFAAGADGTIVSSEDGYLWTREVVPESAGAEILLGIGGNQNALVAAGSGGLLLASPNLITNVVSTNASGQLETNEVSLLGLFWNEIPSGTANDLQGVAASGSAYVVTGAKGTILSSVNGTNWSKRISGTAAYLSGVAASPSGFVACGDSGVILRSADGLLWTPRNSGVESWVYAVRWLDGRFVAVGQGGLILTSGDGSGWTQRASGTTEWINDVTFARNRYVAVAGGGVLVTSPDAVSWTPVKSITSRSLYSIATDGSQWIAAGLEGVMLRNDLAGPQTPVDILSFGVAGPESVLLFGGAIGQRFSLESSSVVTGGWAAEAALEIVGQAGTLIHERTNGRENARFFRTRLLP